MTDYLLELGTEELPAGYIPEAQRSLRELLAEKLQGAGLPFKEIKAFSTPRRLTVIVSELETRQPTTKNRVKGPPAKNCVDASGAANETGNKFAAKHGLTFDKLEREAVGGVEYVFANVTVEGKSAAEVLQEIVPKAVSQLPSERPMRWASLDFKFSRPIRWIVSLLGNEVVPIKIEDVPCGRESAGHRVLSKGKVTISNAANYAKELKSAYVLVDPEERREVIKKQVLAIAESKSGTPSQLKGSLLEEVVNITEWPHAVAGQFAEEYLEMPDTLIETVMVHHQRYFPINKKDAATTQKVNKNDLLPWFITIANNDRAEAEPMIKQGNERVLRARLADGRFFYFDDQKTKLTERKDSLKQLTFQVGLGSYADKADRLMKLAGVLSKQLKLDARLSVCLEKTAELCKLDLVSNLVRELPELQGYVGSWYAEQEGLPPDVVTAISSHYSPRSTDDAIPSDTVGRLAAVADKLDSVVCLFALGKKPSGSSDPFALRRQAQGLVDILMDGLKEYPVDINAVIDELLTWIEPTLSGRKQGFDRIKITQDLNEFLLQRLRGKLLDQGAGREVVDAVLAARDPFRNLPDVVVRCTSLENLFAAAGGMDVVRIGFRIGKILGPDSPDQVDPSVFDCDAEKALWHTFNTTVVDKWCKDGQFVEPASHADYERLLSLLNPLVPVVDEFFVGAMVNDPDEKKKRNRHGMLKQIDRYFRSVADFTKLQSLLA